MNAALLRVEAKDRLAVAAFRYVRSAQIPRSAVAIFDGGFTSTPAAAGQRSTAGFSLQVGNDCSPGSVSSEGQDRF